MRAGEARSPLAMPAAKMERLGGAVHGCSMPRTARAPDRRFAEGALCEHPRGGVRSRDRDPAHLVMPAARVRCSKGHGCLPICSPITDP